MIKIPYGVSNYRMIAEQESLYIDKTYFIELLEDKYKYISFLRPRRFGKSLFISTLLYYYDEYYADIWENLFKNTYIGKNPTKEKSSFRILFLEFSGISIESTKTIYEDFNSKINILLSTYLDKYEYDENLYQLIKIEKSPQKKLESFFKIVKNDKIYILIDEYDNFANAILGESMNSFKKILGKGGFVRSFYEVIKTATQTGIVQRVFITGVTPITMDTMTSGFNIIKDITKDEEFNELAGFNISETKEVLNHLFEECSTSTSSATVNQKKVIDDMISLYNGYKFNINAKEKVFNSTMVMYFILSFDTKRCKYPRELLDVNVASDYKKIMQLFQIGNAEDNYKVLNELIETGKTRANLKSRFDFDKDFERDDFVTLLYSIGFITIDEMIFSKTQFVIPNSTIKTLYFDYFKVELQNRGQIKFDTINLENAIIELALHRNTELLQNEIAEVIKLLSNRDFMKFNEKNLKIIILMILNISKFYYIKSEPEYNHKYPDIMLLKQEPFDVKYQFLFELKWAKRGRRSSATTVTDVALQHRPYKDWNTQKEEGINQIKGYLQLDEIKKINEELQLCSYLIIADGDKVEIIEVN